MDGINGLTYLDSLTGAPVPEDNLVFAMIMAAPLSALSDFKYRVKLVPGSTKKGKASKSAQSAFLASKRCTRIEKDLIKALKDNELAGNLPGKVRITGLKV